MLRNLIPIVAATLVLLIVWASAVPLFHWFQVDDVPNRLEESQSLWQEQAIESYEFVIQKVCFCGPPANTPFKMIVRDTLNIAAYENGTNFDSAGEKIDGLPQSIPALFELVRVSYASEPDFMEVEYDNTYGFPQIISIDASNRIVDDEVKYIVQEFRVIDRPM